MHDKYAYESIEMALHDKEVYRTLGCGMSGLSIAADSLSACKYAKVYPIYNKDAKTTPGHENEYVEGADDDLIVGYRTEGDFPLYGNDDDQMCIRDSRLASIGGNQIGESGMPSDAAHVAAHAGDFGFHRLVHIRADLERGMVCDAFARIMHVDFRRGLAETVPRCV